MNVIVMLASISCMVITREIENKEFVSKLIIESQLEDLTRLWLAKTKSPPHLLKDLKPLPKLMKHHRSLAIIHPLQL